MMRREVQREKLRREQEHLAFSGGLANGIVHDFRNPMSSMRLDVQMLEKEAARGPECRMARVAELVIRIRETLDRMDKVFREFLYLAKPVSDLAERMDLGVCIRDCLDLLAPRFDQAGVRVEAELPGPGALEVVAHEVALRRAFVNVLMNAEQFSTRGSVVRVRAGVEDGAAVLDVLDSGPGISRLARKRIFEMFFSTRPGGTGLGLFLARAAVERSGGTIEAWNRPEGGACFRIRLPRAEPPPAAAGTMTS
jgi:signal transduction histidine kinase